MFEPGLTRRCASLFLLLVMLFLSGPAVADIWGEYCFYNIQGNNVCRDTEADAWAAYNAERNLIADYTPIKAESRTDGSVVLSYVVDFQAPTSVSGYFYGVDLGDGAPDIFGDPCPEEPNESPGCSSEQSIIDYVAAHVPQGATIAVEGQYVDGFVSVEFGMYLHYDDDREIAVTDGDRHYVYKLNRFKHFSCNRGADSTIKWNVGKAPPGEEGKEGTMEQICGGGYAATALRARLTQRTSCPANSNPCYPITGDKARFEEDFNFAGRPFVRTYHSVAQSGSPGLPRGWSMSYGERATSNASTDASGYIDGTQSVAGSYHSIYRRNVVTRRIATGYEQQGEDGLVRRFDGNGVLQYVSDPENPARDVVVEHDSVGRISKLTDGAGRTAQFSYSDRTWSGVVTSIMLDSGATYAYQYDADRNLSAVHYPDGASRQYVYHESSLAPGGQKHLLTGIIDESGQRYGSFGYDTKGRVATSVLLTADGPVESTAITYTSRTAIATVDGAGTKTYNIPVTGLALPTSISVTGGGTYQYVYTLEGRLKQFIDAKYYSTLYELNGAYVTAMTEAANKPGERRTEYSRDAAGNLTGVLVRAKNGAAYVDVSSVSWTYNPRRQKLTATASDPASGTTRTTTKFYCEQADVDAAVCPLVGELLASDGPRTDLNDTTLFAYYLADDPACVGSPATCRYRKGDLRAVTSPEGLVTEFLAYDTDGRLASMKGPDGVVHDFEYDARGRLTRRIVRGNNDAGSGDDLVTRVDYWPTGRIRRITRPDRSYLAYVYDGAHRLVRVTDAAGNKLRYTLDGAGHPLRVDLFDPEGNRRFKRIGTFDDLGRIATEADSRGNNSTYAYDNIGRLHMVTDPLLHTTTYTYDGFDRMTGTYRDDNIETLVGTSFDALDRAVSMSDQKGLGADYVYNAFGDLTTLISSDTGTSTFEYDNAGSRKARLDARGIASNFSYDAMARVTGVSYPTSPALDVEYAYDAVQGGCRAYERFAQGRLTFMSDHSGTTRYCYDRGGGIARKIQRAGGTELAVAYGRNKAGAVTSVTYPDGSVVDYVRSENGDVSEVGVTLMGGSRQVLAGNVTHLPFGAVSGWIFGNGRSMQRPQTLDYRADKIVDSGVGGLSLGFFYDAVGNVRRIEDAFGSSILSRYRYDDFYRLADVQDGPTGTLLERYAYDLSGDRMTLKNSTGTTQYLYGEANHHLLEVNGIGRAYDEAGDTIRIGGAARQFVYDASGRLARAKSDGAILMNYRYNGLGQQVWRYSAPDAPDQRFTAYDEDGRWLGDYGADGVPIQQMVWLDELPIGLLVGAGAQQQLAYVEPDHLGTPRVVIDVARDMPVWSWDIRGEVFGATPPNEDPDGDGAPFVFDMRYPGQRYDAASGLNQNGFRDYEPETGRYVESDPIGTKVGLNTYAYASGDPTSRLDPLGLADIYIWMPLPYTGGIPSYGKLHSAFGHVSVDANGQSFSFGPRGNSVDFWYASRQHQIRNAIVHHLPLSESQEKALANCLAKDQGKYNGVSNNCGSPLQNCMRNIGMPLSAFNAIFPETLNMMLYVNPAVTESYPLYRGEP